MQNALIWLLGLTSFMWLSVAVLSIGIVGRALALRVLWGWFVVPTFALPPLSLAVAAGLVTITYLLFPGQRDARVLLQKVGNDDDDESLAQLLRRLGYSVMAELVLLGAAVALGWIFKQVSGV